MPFDLESAQPISGGFDLNSAKPVGPTGGYIPVPIDDDSEKENIYFEDTDKTEVVPKGTSDELSFLLNDDLFDDPSSTFEESVAQFEKQAAVIALVANSFDMVDDASASEFIANRSKALASAQARQPEYMKKFNKDFEKAEGIFGVIGVALANKRAIGRTVVTQASNSVLPLITGALGAKGGAVAGASIAAVGGQLGPQVALPEELITVPIGAVTGAIVGNRVASAPANALVEVGFTLDQLLQEKGVDVANTESLMMALENDQLMNDLRIVATKKGITTATLDMFFDVAGGKFLKGLKGSSRLKKVGKVGADIGVQTVGEGVSEAGGQYAAFGEVDVKDATLESIASLGQSAGQTAVTAATTPFEMVTQKIQDTKNKRIKSADKVKQVRAKLEDADIENMSPEELTALANEIDITDLERDAISVDSENQLIALENEQQSEIIKEAESLKNQIDNIPTFDVNDKKSVQEKLGRKVQTLTDFIKGSGGIKDTDGELRARDISNKSKVGLITKDNRQVVTINGKVVQDAQIDAVIQRAFDEGYFPDKNSVDEISHSDLYDAIQQDLGGQKIYTKDDTLELNDLFDSVPSDVEQGFYERGIEEGMSVEQIADIIREERGLGAFVERKPLISELENNERLQDRIAEIIEVKEDNYGLISGNLLSRNLEKLTQSDFVQDSKLWFGKAGVPISTRIKNISPKLFVRLRKFEFEVKDQILSDVEAVTPFLRKYRSLDSDSQLALDLALKNGDVELIEFIAKQNNMVEEIKVSQEILENIYARSQDAGVDVDYRKNYFPRRVKDLDGLIDHFKKGEYWNTIERAFQKWSDDNVPLTKESKNELKAYRAKVTKEIKGGETRKLTQAERDKISELYYEKKAKMPRRALNKEEKVKIINSLVRGFSVGGITISRTGSLKRGRSIDQVTADINKFYENPEQTLLAYISSVNETIETSKLFGKGRVIEGEGQLNVEDSVGAFIEEAVTEQQLSNRDTEILKDAFNARFNTGQMGWIASSLRDLTYIDVMGSPLNAITQFGDLASSMFNAGILNTAATIGGAAFDKTKINLRDMAIEDIAQEFDNNNLTSKGVDKVFTMTGLKKIDRVGKLTLVNSTLKKMQKQAKKGDKNFIGQLELYFEGDAGRVLQDIKEGSVTEDVKFLMFNTLADFQPIARSEMPEYYLRSGNLKILYMLKSFTIKQLDVYRREAFTKINQGRKTGNKKMVVEGMTNFIRLAGFWITMGASADYMKDMLKSAFGGDEMDEPEDYVIDNIFKAFGWSRYQKDMIGRDGLGNVMFDLVKPPTKFFDNVQKDLKTIDKEGLTLDNSRSIRSIPVGGELYYFWFGDGSDGNSSSKNSVVKY